MLTPGAGGGVKATLRAVTGTQSILLPLSIRQLSLTSRPVWGQAAAKEAKLVAAPAELNTDADEDQVPFQLNLRCRVAALAR